MCWLQGLQFFTQHKTGTLDWVMTAPCNITAIILLWSVWSVLPRGPQSHGLLCHRTGRCQLWGTADQGVQIFTCSSKSAPVCCKPAESGSYGRRLKYHSYPTEDNEAIFFYLLSNGHLSKGPSVSHHWYSPAAGCLCSRQSKADRWQIVGGAVTSWSVLPV